MYRRNVFLLINNSAIYDVISKDESTSDKKHTF
jgi:hypothetical protein